MLYMSTAIILTLVGCCCFLVIAALVIYFIQNKPIKPSEEDVEVGPPLPITTKFDDKLGTYGFQEMSVDGTDDYPSFHYCMKAYPKDVDDDCFDLMTSKDRTDETNTRCGREEGTTVEIPIINIKDLAQYKSPDSGKIEQGIQIIDWKYDNEPVVC
jgi:hypothetical protein